MQNLPKSVSMGPAANKSAFGSLLGAKPLPGQIMIQILDANIRQHKIRLRGLCNGISIKYEIIYEVSCRINCWPFSKKHMYPDNKVHEAIMGPTWALSAPDEPRVGPMNLAIWESSNTNLVISEIHSSSETSSTTESFNTSPWFNFS